MIKVIDLFSGVGGFSEGFKRAGFKIVAAVEYEKDIGESYQKNHPETKLFLNDIREIDNNFTFSNIQADVIIGGPPCQGFSMAGSRNRNGFIDDPRNYLFKHYFNIVKVVNPKVFVIENVKGLLNLHNGEILNEIKNKFEDPAEFDGNPYKVHYRLLNAKDFGIPQNRERVFLIGSKIDFDFDREIHSAKKYILNNIDPHFFDYVSVGDAISNLPSATVDGIVVPNSPNCQYQLYINNSSLNVKNHIMPNHNDKTLNRIKKIAIDENYKQLNENIKSIHSGSYGRMNPNKISATITTRFDTPSGGKFIHPYENRTITIREAARIQSFSDTFIFTGSKTSMCKQIGNAVPPKMAYFIATMVRNLI